MWTELVMLKVRRNKPSVIYAQDEISGFCQDRSADMTRPRQYVNLWEIYSCW